MVSYVVDIALSVTHLGKVIRGHFDLVLGILNFAFNYGPDRIEQNISRILMNSSYVAFMPWISLFLFLVLKNAVTCLRKEIIESRLRVKLN